MQKGHKRQKKNCTLGVNTVFPYCGNEKHFVGVKGGFNMVFRPTYTYRLLEDLYQTTFRRF